MMPWSDAWKTLLYINFAKLQHKCHARLQLSYRHIIPIVILAILLSKNFIRSIIITEVDSKVLHFSRETQTSLLHRKKMQPIKLLNILFNQFKWESIILQLREREHSLIYLIIYYLLLHIINISSQIQNHASNSYDFTCKMLEPQSSWMIAQDTSMSSRIIQVKVQVLWIIEVLARGWLQ